MGLYTRVKDKNIRKILIVSSGFPNMTDEVYESLRTIVRNRPALAKEPEVDGYSGFLLIDKRQQPKVALHIENEMRRISF